MSILREIKSSETLVVAITGYGNKFGLPIDDFFKQSGLSEMSKIVIIDPTKRKTLGGIPPEHPSFFELLDFLRGEISLISPKKLIVTGASAGAHPALLIGHLLKADYVVAFAPYPYLSFKEGIRMRDPALQSMHRIKQQLDQLPPEVKKFFDLKDVLADWNAVTRYYVHVSRHSEWDYRRAKYLAKVPKLSIISHPYATHAVVTPLARHSKLHKCFEFPYKHAIRPMDFYFHLKSLTKLYVKRFEQRTLINKNQ